MGFWLFLDAKSQTKMDKNDLFMAVNLLPMYKHREFYLKFGKGSWQVVVAKPELEINNYQRL